VSNQFVNPDNPFPWLEIKVSTQCKKCGKPFIKPNRQYTYCSPECSVSGNKAIMRAWSQSQREKLRHTGIPQTPETKLYLAIFGGEEIELNENTKLAIQQMLNNLEIECSRKPHSKINPIDVVRLRYGFEPQISDRITKWQPETPRTLRNIGAYFGVTPGRVCQILLKSLRRMRHPSRSQLILHPLSVDSDARAGIE
jgi:hypothetical protein